MADMTTPDKDRPLPTNVVQAIARVMEELPGIGKDSKSPQGFAYRGIEAITAAAQHLMGRYCVVFAPRVIERKTIELTIGGKPWTEEQLQVVYTVYGPGGVGDSIEVGPVWGLGRDNSDKGTNKALTQAYKYALLQTFAIGDSKADSDHEEAHEADARRAETGPSEGEKLVQRVKGLDPAVKAHAKLGEWCEENGIPRLPSQMSEAQVAAVNRYLDKVEAATTAPAPEPKTESKPPRVPPPPPRPPAPPKDPVDEIAEHVKSMNLADVDKALEARGRQPTGNPQNRKRMLAALLVHEKLGTPAEAPQAAQEAPAESEPEDDPWAAVPTV